MPGERLLIIEDDKKIADLVRRVATEMEFATNQATGKQLKETYDTLAPEIIVMDILMPEMDGLEVLRFIEERKLQPRIIILSGSPNAYRKMAQNLGTAFGFPIDANIQKPFRIGELRSALEKSRKELAASRPSGEASA